jgi:hypothetical protein
LGQSESSPRHTAAKLRADLPLDQRIAETSVVDTEAQRSRNEIHSI